MREIATVIADGLNVREKPLPNATKIDALAKGEEIEIDETTAPCNGWRYGRVHKVQNNLVDAFGHKRTDRRGWFYARGTVDIRHEPGRIDPDRINSPHFPRWLMPLIGAVVAAVVGVIFLVIYG